MWILYLMKMKLQKYFKNNNNDNNKYLTIYHHLRTIFFKP